MLICFWLTAKQHIKYFLALTKLSEIYHSGHTLAVDNKQIFYLLWLFPWWVFASVFAIINTINLVDSRQKLLSRSPSAGLLQLLSFHPEFLGPSAQIAWMANRSRISSIRMFTGRISASHYIALTSTELNAPKILCKPVFWTC